MALPGAALVAALLSFASAVSGLPIPDGPLPTIALASAFHGVPIGLNERFAGVTDNTDGAITLYSEWQPDVAGYCLLAHELTHFLQEKNNAPTGCMQREVPAYRVTAMCYRAYGRRDQERWARNQMKHPPCFP